MGVFFHRAPIAALLLAKDDTSTAVVASAFTALLSCELHSLVATAMKDMGYMLGDY
jgi:hypothetical protein